MSLLGIIPLLYFAIRWLTSVIEPMAEHEPEVIEPMTAVLDEAGNKSGHPSMEVLQARYYTSEPESEEGEKEPEVYHHRPRLLNIYYRSEFAALIEQMLKKGIISRL
ncbi:MAG: hypothetical protein IIZ27_01845 [Solobacterium sp.]|nr:hypothetical protein [Solobacterium sp.]